MEVEKEEETYAWCDSFDQAKVRDCENLGTNFRARQ